MAIRELKFPTRQHPPDSIHKYCVALRSRFIPRFLLVPSDYAGCLEVVDVLVNNVSQSVRRNVDDASDSSWGSTGTGATSARFYSENQNLRLPEVDYDHVEAGEELAVIVRNCSVMMVTVSLVFVGETEDTRRKDKR